MEAKTSDPDFWADSQKAQSTMRQIGALKDTLTTWQQIASKAADLQEIIGIALAENDESLKEEIHQEIDTLVSRFDAIEVLLMLDGPYDSRDVILAFHAGAGGTESQDWAQMLMRMYIRWAERKKFQADIFDVSPGDEAGIKSATLGIKGSFIGNPTLDEVYSRYNLSFS